MLKIKNLKISVEEKELLHDINLEILDGQTHVIMGPNGAGKSTLCKAIMSYPNLKKDGLIQLNNEDITNHQTNQIAQKGIYYIAQNPIEIEGVTNAELLRSALQQMNKPMDIFTFNKASKEICEKLDIPKNFLHREVNVSMSGGEKKKNELLGLWFLKPKLIILDEIDSGLDVDAVKVVAQNLLEYQKETNCSIIMVTHQPTLLELLKPSKVHILVNKTIIKTK